MNTETSSKAESHSDFGKDAAGLAKRWISAIKLAKKDRKEWVSRSEKIVKRYRDERPESDTKSQYNVLWSNVQTLMPSLYAQTPKALVTRRHKTDDPVGLQLATVLERAADYSLDENDFDEVMESAVEDRLLPGIGVARVDYKPYYTTETDAEGNKVQSVAYEQAPCRYIHWKDFLHGPARTWSEVSWVAYRSFMTREKLEKRFGEAGSKVPLDYKPDLGDEDLSEQFKKAEIWEIWCKESKKVIWLSLSKGDAPLDYRDPHLKLAKFFPSPKPIFATTTTGSLIPVPDYVEYQDQAQELDTLTARIDHLTSALRVTGVYDASAEGLQRLLSEGSENRLIPVENWAVMAQKGGLDNAVSWLPIEQIARVLSSLYEAREQVKQTMYEITGLSDIVRGSTDPNETLGAQRLKGQFVNRRLRQHQAKIAKFARDLIELQIEVMAEHFSPQTLSLMSGIQVDEQVVALMRNDLLRRFRVDIETDSTLQPDEQADKEARVEFLSAVAQFIQTAVPAAQQMPQIGPLLGEMLLFGVRGFHIGRELEESIENAVNAPQQPQEGAGEGASQIEQQRVMLDEKRLQVDAQRAQTDAALEARELSLKEQEFAHRARMEIRDSSTTQDLAQLTSELRALIASIAPTISVTNEGMRQ